MKNEQIFSLKFVGILKSVKIRELPEFLKFITFLFSMYRRGISFRCHLDDTLFRPSFTLSFARQWSWLPSGGWCLACCSWLENRAAGMGSGH